MKIKCKIICQLFAFALLQCLPSLMKSQITFQKVYSNTNPQSGRDVLPTSDGGYIIAGSTNTQIPGDTDLYIIKTDSIGNIVWTKTYGGSKPDYPYCMINTNDGNFFIAGFTASYSPGIYNSWLLKIDNLGDTIWTKTYSGSGNDAAKEIIATADGNYTIAGRSDSNAYLMKIDPFGTVIWSKIYGGTDYETSHSVKQCLDGGYIFIGQTYSYGIGSGDIWVVRTNSTGDTVWTKTFGGAGIDDGNSILANSDGSFVICAETNSIGAGDYDVQMIKTNSMGVVIWNRTYGGTDKDISHMVQRTSDGNYVIAAISRSFGWITPDMWIVKVNDAVGDTMWTRHYGGADHEHCYAVKETSDGGLIVLGHSKSFTGYTEIMFLKINSLGYPGTVSIEEFASDNNLNMYPNPSEGIVQINMKGDLSNSTLKITDALGQTVFSETLNAFSLDKSRTVDLNNREPGIYFLTLQSGKRISTGKLILK